MQQLAVLNVVGLSPELIGKHTPRIARYAGQYGLGELRTILPALTCSVQSSLLTGQYPADHGIVGNGWYFRDLCEVAFWKQSNRLVRGEKVWDMAKRRDPNFTCANICWWYNMYSTADYSLTPRPLYPADGRKIPDFYCEPPQIRDFIEKDLGAFPLFSFWGPKTHIRASAWIADAAMRIFDRYRPTLSLVYLPHLDYCLQRHGPNPEAVAQDLRDLDATVGRLLDFYEKKGVKTVLLSEYGITEVSRPLYPNRLLRRQGYLRVKTELGRELLDAGASRAFAVADHQIAHVYVRDPADIRPVRALLRDSPGVEAVWDKEEQKARGLAHGRSGDLLALADEKSWFAYYYWEEDRKAPDFARTVDIHRKPGYDPAELFLDPKMRFALPRVFWKLLKKKLGFRQLMDVIPLDASLVKGSHGRLNASPAQSPVFVAPGREAQPVHATEVAAILLEMIFGEKAQGGKGEK